MLLIIKQKPIKIKVLNHFPIKFKFTWLGMLYRFYKVEVEGKKRYCLANEELQNTFKYLNDRSVVSLRLNEYGKYMISEEKDSSHLFVYKPLGSGVRGLLQD